MICELYISIYKTDFNKNIFKDISEFILSVFDPVKIPEDKLDTIYNFMLHDKKNDETGINCILLKKIGTPVFDKNIEKEEIFKALNHFNKI
jgi:3-dehydroquinate synthase